MTRMEYGRRFRVELSGASHAPEVGVRIEGVPRGTPVDLESIQRALDRRRPLGRSLASRRQESDRLIVDAGLEDGQATGEPFRAHVANEDARPAEYANYRFVPRPGHADYPARVRYGESADLAGGGIFSGRMTVGLVIAGGIGAQMLSRAGVETVSFTRSIGPVDHLEPETTALSELATRSEANEVGCPDPDAARRMAEVIAAARRDGDSVGGVIETRVTGLPVGLGEPFFDSVEAVLAHLALSVPAVKGVEFGAGFASARLRGSEHNDAFFFEGERVWTRTNHAGGLLGGLTDGMPVVYRVAVKPTSSIAREQESVDLARRASARVRVGPNTARCWIPTRAMSACESKKSALPARAKRT